MATPAQMIAWPRQISTRAHIRGFRRWVGLRRRYGRPSRVLFQNGGAGDQLLCTCVLREWRRRGDDRVWFLATDPELMAGNKDARAIIPYDVWLVPWLRLSGTPVQTIYYNRLITAPDARDEPPREHILAALCRQAGLQGEVVLRPYSPVTVDPPRRAGRSRPRVAIQCNAMSARYPIANKQWPVERFQAVVQTLAGEVDFVQVGSPRDPVLVGTENRLGAGGVQGLANLLADADLLLGLVGFAMHFARALERPAVIVYGGRELPEFSGYPGHHHIVRRPGCAPCWWYSKCDYEHRCMQDITPPEVVAAVRRALERPPTGPLPELRVTL